MARYRGTVEGGSPTGSVAASRLGRDYITTNANGWSCGVNVDGGPARDVNDQRESTRDQFTVFATGGSDDGEKSRKSHRIAEVKEVREGDRFVRQVTLFDAKGKVVEVYTV